LERHEVSEAFGVTEPGCFSAVGRGTRECLANGAGATALAVFLAWREAASPCRGWTLSAGKTRTAHRCGGWLQEAHAECAKQEKVRLRTGARAAFRQ